MTADSWPTRGDFSSQARIYAQARPGYPDRLIQQLIHHVGVKPGDPVADIGAGTGLFTRQLASHGLRLHAVEPNPVMRQQAGDLPGVTWHEGSFEATTLPDHCVTWVTAAQAFHWAKRPAALVEIARILRPGGHLTVLWNRPLNEENPVTRWTMEALGRHVPGFTDIYQDTRWADELTAGGHFGRPVFMEEMHIVPMSAERYLDLWRSHNHLAVTAGPQRLGAFLDELADHLGRHHLATIDVPYLCQSWTAPPRK